MHVLCGDKHTHIPMYIGILYIYIYVCVFYVYIGKCWDLYSLASPYVGNYPQNNGESNGKRHGT